MPTYSIEDETASILLDTVADFSYAVSVATAHNLSG